MFDLQTLVSLVPSILDWFKTSKTNNRQYNEDYEAALAAFYVALSETRIYIGSLDKRIAVASDDAHSKPRDREAEANLSRLWTQASIRLRNFNPELAGRCLMKGDYWANPAQWSQSDVREARIQISKVFEEARNLLNSTP